MSLFNIFESPKYQPAMFFAMILVSLLIMFSVANMLEDNQELFSEKNYKELEKKLWENRIDDHKLNNKRGGITGYAISDEEENSDIDNNETVVNESAQLYTEKAYFMYYMVLLVLGIGSLILAGWIFLPKVKKYT